MRPVNGMVVDHNATFPYFLEARNNADSVTNNNNYTSEFYNTADIGDNLVGVGYYIKRSPFNPPGYGGTTAHIISLQSSSVKRCQNL